MEEILDYLGRAEGREVHRNDGESDITAPYGVYRTAHPDANVFKVIDRVVAELGIVYDSKDWNSTVIGKINEYIKANPVIEAEVMNAVVEFYEEYLEGAHLELFPRECRVAMMSMYTNSPRLAWQSVQRAILDLVAMRKTGLIRSEVSIDDGIYGKKTEGALKHIHELVDENYLETLMLFHMLGSYVELWSKNPDKYGKYLLGWKNRMSKLTKS